MDLLEYGISIHLPSALFHWGFSSRGKEFSRISHHWPSFLFTQISRDMELRQRVCDFLPDDLVEIPSD
jgi:hypothetical protein